MLRKPSAGARPADPLDLVGDPRGQRLAATPDAEQNEPALGILGFEHLLREARDDARDLVVPQEHAARGVSHAGSFNARNAASTRASSLR